MKDVESNAPEVEVLELRTPSGKQVVVEVGERETGAYLTRIEVDGKTYCGNGEVYDPPKGAPAGVVGAISTSGGPKIGLDEPSARALREAIERRRANPSPRMLAARKWREREGLVARVAAAEGAWHDRRARAWERGDERGTFVGSEAEAADRKIEEARAALRAFDERHPEVRERLERERSRAAADALWR